MSEGLLLAVKHALRVERGHLDDLLREGWGRESLPVAAAEFNISMYRLAINKYEDDNRGVTNNPETKPRGA
jgi:hypothetical protein